MPFLWSTSPVGGSFLLGQTAFIVVAHVLLALLLGGWRQDRPWAAAAFLLPVTGALINGRLFERMSETAGLALALAAVFAALAAWSLVPLGRGAPIVASGAGAALGAEILRFRIEDFHGFATSPGAAAGLLSFGVAALGITLLAARLPAALARPGVPVALIVAAAGFGIVAGLATLAPGRRLLRPPDSLPTSAQRPPVVLIVLDTVRADHLKHYGYARDTMPRLERFGVEGVWVERSITNHPSSLETHASIFTGLYPPHHGAHGDFGDISRGRGYPRLRDDVPTLAGILAQAGYWTVGVSGNSGPLAPQFGLGRGFHVYRALPDEFKRASPWRALLERAPGFESLCDRLPLAVGEFCERPTERRAASITDEAIAAVEAAGDKPFFLFLNYIDAHEPYDPPGDLRDHFPGRHEELGLGTPSVETRDAVLSGARDLTRAESEHLAAHYDGELLGLDVALGRLLDRLRSHPRWRDLLVIVTADHGEALGEHRYIGHGVQLYDELVHVPLLVKSGAGTPEAPAAGTTWPALVQSVDLFPMVLQHAGVPVPEGIDGVAWGRGRGAALSWAYLSGTYADRYPLRFNRQLRAVESAGWKLIVSDRGGLELYDLGADPGELKNLAANHPDRVASLAALLGPAEPAARAQTQRPPLPADVLERLRSLGYVR